MYTEKLEVPHEVTKSLSIHREELWKFENDTRNKVHSIQG